MRPPKKQNPYIPLLVNCSLAIMMTGFNLSIILMFKSQRDKKVIIELSKLMRHTLYDAENQRVSLESEIAFVSNYISIMRVRYPEHPSPETRIPPLLFMPLLENAFKHGVSYVNDTAIDVKINEYEDNVSFFCRNTKPPAPRSSGWRSTICCMSRA